MGANGLCKISTAMFASKKWRNRPSARRFKVSRRGSVRLPHPDLGSRRHASPSIITSGRAATAADIQELRQHLKAEIDRITVEGKSSSGQEVKAIDEHLHLARSLDALYVHHQLWLDEKAKADQRLADEKKGLEADEKFNPDEPRPYSFLLLERLKDELLDEKSASGPSKPTWLRPNNF